MNRLSRATCTRSPWSLMTCSFAMCARRLRSCNTSKRAAQCIAAKQTHSVAVLPPILGVLAGLHSFEIADDFGRSAGLATGRPRVLAEGGVRVGVLIVHVRGRLAPWAVIVKKDFFLEVLLFFECVAEDPQE